LSVRVVVSGNQLCKLGTQRRDQKGYLR